MHIRYRNIFIFISCTAIFLILYLWKPNLHNERKVVPLSNKDSEVCGRVKELTQCWDKELVPRIEQRSTYWVLYNYITASKTFRCHESITYTTNAEYMYLDNVPSVVSRWNGPVSVAIHAPGTDFYKALESIQYLRECDSSRSLIKDLVTFHIYFDTDHVPKRVASRDQLFQTPLDCKQVPVFLKPNQTSYRRENKILYPVNVGRNIARSEVQTYYNLVADIELYPSPDLINQFLEMISRKPKWFQNRKPKVFPLHLFEVKKDQQVPNNKTQLQAMMVTGDSIFFHKHICSACHQIPESAEWLAAEQTQYLEVFTVGKRTGTFHIWEPIYIGTNEDPLYDERLSWEGRRDKMTQALILCILDYDFAVLNNAFLVHKPGIKIYKKDLDRGKHQAKTNSLIDKNIVHEIENIYGSREGCTV